VGEDIDGEVLRPLKVCENPGGFAEREQDKRRIQR
jgi:hypothetical protein